MFSIGKIVSMISPVAGGAIEYGYSNTRIKAMKGAILSKNQLQEFIKIGSVESIIEAMQKTNYKKELDEGAAEYSGVDLIEYATTRNFAKTAQTILGMTPKKDQKMVSAILLKWDLLNIKTMLLAKKVGKKYEQIKASLIPIGGLNEEDFAKIMKSDLKEMLLQIRKTNLGKIILTAKSIKKSKKLKDSFVEFFQKPEESESALDSHIYLLMDGLLATGGNTTEFIRSALRSEIDARNIIIIERLKSQNETNKKIRDSLIHGGTLTENLVSKLIESKSLQGIIDQIKDNFDISIRELSISNLENALEKSVASKKVTAFYRADASAALGIGFLLLKAEEMNNLRKIAKAREFGLSDKEIGEMLV